MLSFVFWSIQEMGYFFLPYKPGALHPAASAPFKALACFCPFTLLAVNIE